MLRSKFEEEDGRYLAWRMGMRTKQLFLAFESVGWLSDLEDSIIPYVKALPMVCTLSANSALSITENLLDLEPFIGTYGRNMPNEGCFDGEELCAAALLRHKILRFI